MVVFGLAGGSFEADEMLDEAYVPVDAADYQQHRTDRVDICHPDAGTVHGIGDVALTLGSPLPIIDTKVA